MYTQLLVNGLIDSSFIEYAAVLTEKCPNVPNFERLQGGALEIFRRFPFRAGVVDRTFTRYIQYALQSLHFIAIPWVTYRCKASHLLVHSSFHNHPNLMWVAVWIVRKFMPSVCLISDVRDPKLPASRFWEIALYHSIVCCSENVFECLAKSNELKYKLTSIPVVIDIIKPSELEIQECKKKYGLESTPYLFSGSGISQEKGIDKALEVTKLLKGDRSDLCLVVAGRKRDWSSCHDKAVGSGVLRYLGTIPHRDVFCLSAGSEVDVNFSRVDSMPRATLEALAAGALVLLPKGVPEFERTCKDYVLVSGDARQIAKQIETIIKRKCLPSYDIKPHLPDNVYLQYQSLFSRGVR